MKKRLLHGDKFLISETPVELSDRIESLINGEWTEDTFKSEFSLGKNYGPWVFSNLNNLSLNETKIQSVAYRVFDKKFSYFDNNLMWRWRIDTAKHFFDNDNLGIVFRRQSPESKDLFVFLSDRMISDGYIRSDNKGGETIAPLYLYPDENDLDQTRRVNMDPKIRAAIEKAATNDDRGTPNEVDIFDYIYGVLHCPAYRETYADFLKIDFPRVPYPSSPTRFWDISAKGGELRKLHLMDGVDAGLAYPFKGIVPEDEDGSVGTIGKKSYQMSDDETGNVLINDHQYFEGVPKTAWEFYIGGYQPAQKWLKDRKGRELSFDDRMHYRKIIHILMETDRIMKTIEMDFD